VIIASKTPATRPSFAGSPFVAACSAFPGTTTSHGRHPDCSGAAAREGLALISDAGLPGILRSRRAAGRPMRAPLPVILHSVAPAPHHGLRSSGRDGRFCFEASTRKPALRRQACRRLPRNAAQLVLVSKRPHRLRRTAEGPARSARQSTRCVARNSPNAYEAAGWFPRWSGPGHFRQVPPRELHPGARGRPCPRAPQWTTPSSAELARRCSGPVAATPPASSPAKRPPRRPGSYALSTQATP